MSGLTDPTLLSIFTKLNIFGLFLLSGAALGMYIFAIPLIQSCSHHPSGPLPFSSRVMLRQFELLITLGQAYMQRSSRTLFALLLINCALLYLSRDRVVSKQGTNILMAALILVQTAWYEVVFIFPTNDRLVNMRRELEMVYGRDDKEGEVEADKRMRPEIMARLESWSRWHIGRIVLPVIAGLIMLFRAT